MWRLEGWANPYHVEEELEHCAYEAGADAMLKALKKTGIHYSKDFHSLLCYPPQGKTGWLVFIPDEEVKDENQD